MESEQNDANGCRLCLDVLGVTNDTIQNLSLQERLRKVFYFPVEPTEGLTDNVCNNCTNIIDEFYCYAEKVRQNQENLAFINFEALREIKAEPLEVKLTESQIDCTEEKDFKEPKEEESSAVSENDCKEENNIGEDLFAVDVQDDYSSESDYQPPKKRKYTKRGTKVPKEEKLKSEKKPAKTGPSNLSKEEQEKEDRLIHEFYRMACDICDHLAEDYNALLAHFRLQHQVRGYLMCCQKKLIRWCHLREHMHLHNNPMGFLCEICNKSFKSLRMHQLLKHARPEDLIYKCKICPQAFSKGCLLRAHESTHEKVQCPHCERMLANKVALAAHIHNKHSDIDRRLICDTCGQEFLNKQSFERHCQEHLGIEVVKKVQCHICQKWLKGERVLKNHIKFTHYEGDEANVCDICNQHYPNPRAVVIHKKAVHVEKKFECEFCGKKFKRASNLKEHRTIHTGERLYSCDYCGVSMNSKANLYTHVKKNHPMEWAEKKRLAAEANVPTNLKDSVKYKPHCSNAICHGCRNIISEFYQYAEKVRVNQQIWDKEQVKNDELTVGDIKVELLDVLQPGQCEQDIHEPHIDINPKSGECFLENENDCVRSDNDPTSESPEPASKKVSRKKRTLPQKKVNVTPKKNPKETVEQSQESERQINEFYRMTCDVCDHHAATYIELLNHYRKDHKIRGYVRCCRKKLVRRENLMRHMQMHSDPNTNRCEICNKTYRDLKLHRIQIHANPEEKIFKCNICPRGFAREALLKGHLATHEKVRCPHCDRMLSNKGSLTVHIVNKHSDIDRRMICDTCGQEFLNKQSLEKHVKQHMGIAVAEKQQCHICQKWLKDVQGLRKHIQFTHEERKQTHICDICDQQYPNTKALFSHKRAVHVNSTFECDFCEKKFKRAINLKEHRTIHTGERLYSCDYCDATMNSNANLYNHVKKSHPLEWAEKKRLKEKTGVPSKSDTTL
ncbi:transcription factor grauzone-like [Uranotaenia lowii]|uniref:transcription factor grauzone-like n=1 Tax=Uranotaenia lowii TaxID=190385 RepID=UPI00247ADCE9|nr:transcription factor grauzone-like [Uranotaenia lowii]